MEFYLLYIFETTRSEQRGMIKVVSNISTEPEERRGLRRSTQAFKKGLELLRAQIPSRAKPMQKNGLFSGVSLEWTLK